jgi:hypothetical protein
MKKFNSILMGRKKMPSTSYGMKLLFVPCLISMLFLSSFKSDGTQQGSITSFSKNNKAPAFTDPWVRTTYAMVFEDLDGTQYQDFWVEFFDESYNYVTVYDLTLNYELAVTRPTATFPMSQVLNGNHVFLLEDNVLYLVPLPGGSFREYYYNILPGTGYTL